MVVFVKDRFELATAPDIDPDELAKVTRPEFRRLPLTGPRVVGALGPVDAKERERILFASILGGTDLHNFPQHYVPYEQVATEAAARGLTLAKAREVEPNAAAAIAAYLPDPAATKLTCATFRCVRGERGLPRSWMQSPVPLSPSCPSN